MTINRTIFCAAIWSCGVGAIACRETTPSPEDKKGAVASARPAPLASAGPSASPTPAALPGFVPAVDNPATPAKIALGRQLFFDARLSVDGSRACYSCHQNEDGTGGHDAKAVGAKQKQLSRHAPVMWNVGYLPRLYWDGRASSLEALTKAAWAGGGMGIGGDGLAAKATELGAIPGYGKQFAAVFPNEGATPDTVVRAIAAYERTLTCNDTPWDRHEAGDRSAMTDEQRHGFALFTDPNRANCGACHTPPHFSDAYLSKEGAFHNIGIGIEGKERDDVDVGRKKVTKADSDWAAFKTPTLRNVSKTAPYFHDGSGKTLEDAVRFMAGGGYDNPNKDPKLTDRKLSDQDIGDLVAFLGALDCRGTLEEPSLP